MRHRSWFPTIVFGLSLLLAVFFIGVIKNRGGEGFFAPRESQLPRTQAVTQESYRSSVNVILDAYTAKKDAKAAYNALVLLLVPAPDQAVHFSLVVAFGKLSSGQKDDGEARITALKAENDWLHL